MITDSDVQRALCVQFTYNAKFSPEEALNFTRHSFPNTSLDEVNMLSELFAMGYSKRISGYDKKRELNKKEPERDVEEDPNRVSLDTVPPEVLKEILQYSSIEDQSQLHRTSFALSTFVADAFKTYEMIDVFLVGSMVRMIVREQIPIVTRGPKIKQTEDNLAGEKRYETTIEEALSTLKSIFETPNVKIGDLILDDGGAVNERMREEFIFEVYSLLEELETKIYVEKFIAPSGYPDLFLSVVNKIKVGPLVEWHIFDNSDKLGDFEVFQMDKLVQSPHWNNLKRLGIRKLWTNLKPIQFAHIPSVTVNPPLLASIEDFLSYRDKLLQVPNEIFHQIELGNVERILNALKPFTSVEDVLNESGTNWRDNARKLHYEHSSPHYFHGKRIDFRRVNALKSFKPLENSWKNVGIFLRDNGTLLYFYVSEKSITFSADPHPL